MTSRSIVFIGPLPPPVHGFSEINRRMLARLQENSSVVVFDISPRGSGRWHSVFGNCAHLLWQFFTFLVISVSGQRKSLYLPLSGGYRQFIDACFAGTALMCGMPVFIHHHSFAYLNRETVYARIVLRLLRNSVHIVLCEHMGEMLCSRYPIPKDKLRVISNAVFLDEIQKEGIGLRSERKLLLGFLSNITEAKGCFDFIDLVNAAVANDMPVEGVMAGPVQAEIKRAFADAISSSEFVKHIGPVYGDEKRLFLSQIDVLVFPTRYENEAEPVTIWEAMAAGVPVIAVSRGCISSMITSDVGLIVKNPSLFIEEGIEAIRYFLDNGAALAEMKFAAQSEFENAKQLYTNNLANLILEILGD